jgi:hypothetical protein
MQQGGGGFDTHDDIMDAISKVVRTVPLKTRKRVGWCDKYFDLIAEAISIRNEAAKAHASTKSERAKQALKTARKKLKKFKIHMKNEWLKEQLQE